MAPHSAAKEQHQLANGRFRAGDYAAAAELYGAALHHVPAADLAPEGDLGPAAAASRAYEVTLLSNRAECHLRLGELDPAQRDVERALALDPEHAKSRKRQTRVAQAREKEALARAQAMATRNMKLYDAVVAAQEQLINGVDSPAALAALGPSINAQHFAEVVEERVHSLGVCGYPLCDRPVAQVKQGQLLLSPKAGQVFETVQPSYCSGRCRDCAKDFIASLPETPVVIAADMAPLPDDNVEIPAGQQEHQEQQQDQQQQQQEEEEQGAASTQGAAAQVASVVERGDATAGGDFQAAAVFAGQRSGRVFQSGKHGVGYYRDRASDGPEADGDAEPEPEPEHEPEPRLLSPEPEPEPELGQPKRKLEALEPTAPPANAASPGVGKRAHNTVPQVSPFLGASYTLQQWANPASIRAFAPSTGREDGCMLSEPPALGIAETEIREALQHWMGQTAARFGLTAAVAAEQMARRIANFASASGVGGGLDPNSSHGCHTLLLPAQWQMICLAIAAAVLAPPTGVAGGHTCYTVPLPEAVLDGAKAVPIAEDELRSLLLLLRC